MNTIPEQVVEPNPFKLLRIKHNISQRKIAESAGVTPQVVLLNEFGCYNFPNPKILEFFEQFGEQSAVLEIDYESFRRESRDAALSGVANPRLSPQFPRKPRRFDLSDLQEWTRFKKQFAPSSIGFCKVLCIQPSILNSFENSFYSRNWPAIKEWLWPDGV